MKKAESAPIFVRMDKNSSTQNSILIASAFVVLIWSLKLGESMLGVSLHHLGVYPQTPSGLVGIVTGPLIHGSWQHVTGNTLPILLLGSMLVYGYPKSRWWALSIIWLISGLGVWWFARASFHIGASGLTHGMFFYLFVGGILRHDKRSSALLMAAFYMYGAMLLTIFPTESGISFEYHLFGAMSGAVCAVVFRHWDPKPEKKTYSWEIDTNESDMAGEEWVEDSIIGDQWKNEDDPPEPGSDVNPHKESRSHDDSVRS